MELITAGLQQNNTHIQKYCKLFNQTIHTRQQIQYICLCLLCTVVCMHNFHSAHIFIVCNMGISYNQVNVFALFDHYHNFYYFTDHFVHSPLNSYFIYIGYWILNIYCYICELSYRKGH